MKWVPFVVQRWVAGVSFALFCAGASAGEGNESCHLVIPSNTKGAIDLGFAAAQDGYHDTAIRILLPIADGGNAEAQYQLGMAFHVYSEPKDDQEAFRSFLKAAQQGHMWAQGQVETMYRLGMGVGKDEAAADEWANKYQEQRRAYYRAKGCDADAAATELANCVVRTGRERAAQGNPDDEYQVGEGYHFTQKDPVQAVNWYDRAAKHGSNEAAERLGEMYEAGKQIKQDYKKAADLYALAAKRGDEWSQNALGLLYEDGKGVRQNLAEAAYWFQKSAEQGDPYAALSLGRIHFLGWGVPRSDEKALYWVGSAACYGLPQAKSLLEYIKLHPRGVVQPTAPQAHKIRMFQRQLLLKIFRRIKSVFSSTRTTSASVTR
jgi:TPR repeat protein